MQSALYRTRTESSGREQPSLAQTRYSLAVLLGIPPEPGNSVTENLLKY